MSFLHVFFLSVVHVTADSLFILSDSYIFYTIFFFSSSFSLLAIPPSRRHFPPLSFLGLILECVFCGRHSPSFPLWLCVYFSRRYSSISPSSSSSSWHPPLSPFSFLLFIGANGLPRRVCWGGRNVCDENENVLQRRMYIAAAFALWSLFFTPTVACIFLLCSSIILSRPVCLLCFFLSSVSSFVICIIYSVVWGLYLVSESLEAHTV